MPPKRKAPPFPAEESPNKRAARSTVSGAPTAVGRTTRSTSGTIAPETPTRAKPKRTYGKKQRTESVSPQKEELDHDELDLLTPQQTVAETTRTTKKTVIPFHNAENIATPRTNHRVRSLVDHIEQKEPKSRSPRKSKSPLKKSQQRELSDNESDTIPPTPSPTKPRTAKRTYSKKATPKSITTSATPRHKPKQVPQLEPESESDADVPSLPPSPTKNRGKKDLVKALKTPGTITPTRKLVRKPEPQLSEGESESDAPSPPPSPSKSKSRKERQTSVYVEIPVSPTKNVLSAVPPRLRPDTSEPSSPFSTPRKPKIASPVVLPQETTPTHDRYMELPSSPASRPTSPSKQRQPYSGKALPPHLHTCLHAQKRATIQRLREPATFAEPGNTEEALANEVAFQQLSRLLEATVARGESNSCLLIGPRGSGKSSIARQCLSNVSSSKPVIIRLNGHTQPSDRLAMREIAVQLREQIGPSLKSFGEVFTTLGEEIESTGEDGDVDMSGASNMALPPSSHLPALISVLPNLPRPVVVVLDAFDLFALHPRQSLLYCLFDTVQSCHTTKGTKGLLVVGLTTRIDTITTLEKRVKSRFSGRMLRCAPPLKLDDWEGYVRKTLLPPIDPKEYPEGDTEIIDEWTAHWQETVEEFIGDSAVQNIFRQSHAIAQDIRLLSRLLLPVIANLSPLLPAPSVSSLERAAAIQRARPQFPLLYALPYPHHCLLIASVHVETAGHNIFTFEMLHTHFRDQLRASTSAPVQLNGGSIGMMKCSRKVLLAAFENLIESKLFISTTAYTPNVGKEFVKYRSAVGRTEIKKAIEQTGQINLKKWLTKLAT